MGKTSKKNKVVIKDDESFVSEEEEQPKEKTMTFSSSVPVDDDFSGEEGSYGGEGEDYGPEGSEDYGKEDDYGSDDDDLSDDDGEGGNLIYSDEECVSVHEEGEEKAAAKANDPEAVEERRKQKRIEKLEKRIKALQKKKAKMTITKRSGKYERTTAEIKNKHKRQEVVIKRRMEKNAVNKLKTLETKKMREELGEEKVPKGTTQTIESMRVPDETLMNEEDHEDEDIIGEQSIDEFMKYFNRETTPKILMTTNRRPRGKVFDFMKEVAITIPNV